MTETISILLVDDHALVRDTLRDRLQQEPDFHVVATAGDADEAVSLTLRLNPKIILMDIDMPGLLSFDAAKTIGMLAPDSRIIFLSAFFHDRYIDQALRVQSAGYLTKSDPPDTVVQAIRTVASGGVCFSPRVASQIVIDRHGAHLAEKPQTRIDLLTSRELEVLGYIASGLTKKDIAQIMRISVKTVDRHAAALMAKLNIHDRVKLARFAIREGLTQA